MCQIFSLDPSKKPVTRENWDKLSVYFSILNDEIDQNTNFAKLSSAKWHTCKFYHSKIEK